MGQAAEKAKKMETSKEKRLAREAKLGIDAFLRGGKLREIEDEGLTEKAKEVQRLGQQALNDILSVHGPLENSKVLRCGFIKSCTKHAADLGASRKRLGNLKGLWQAKKAKNRRLLKLVTALAENVKTITE